MSDRTMDPSAPPTGRGSDSYNSRDEDGEWAAAEGDGAQPPSDDDVATEYSDAFNSFFSDALKLLDDNLRGLLEPGSDDYQAVVASLLLLEEEVEAGEADAILRSIEDFLKDRDTQDLLNDDPDAVVAGLLELLNDHDTLNETNSDDADTKEGYSATFNSFFEDVLGLFDSNIIGGLPDAESEEYAKLAEAILLLEDEVDAGKGAEIIDGLKAFFNDQSMNGLMTDNYDQYMATLIDYIKAFDSEAGQNPEDVINDTENDINAPPADNSDEASGPGPTGSIDDLKDMLDDKFDFVWNSEDFQHAINESDLAELIEKDQDGVIIANFKALSEHSYIQSLLMSDDNHSKEEILEYFIALANDPFNLDDILRGFPDDTPEDNSEEDGKTIDEGTDSDEANNIVEDPPEEYTAFIEEFSDHFIETDINSDGNTDVETSFLSNLVEIMDGSTAFQNRIGKRGASFVMKQITKMTDHPHIQALIASGRADEAEAYLARFIEDPSQRNAVMSDLDEAYIEDKKSAFRRELEERYGQDYQQGEIDKLMEMFDDRSFQKRLINDPERSDIVLNDLLADKDWLDEILVTMDREEEQGRAFKPVSIFNRHLLDRFEETTLFSSYGAEIKEFLGSEENRELLRGNYPFALDIISYLDANFEDAVRAFPDLMKDKDPVTLFRDILKAYAEGKISSPQDYFDGGHFE